MAKRKRLTPAQAGFVAPDGAPEAAALSAGEGALVRPGAGASVRPPIAAQAGEAAAISALETLRGEWEAAREGGRLVVALPLEAIHAEHLVRDRVGLDEEAMGALKESLRVRGQQTPIEVVALEGGRFGLISGWRRLTALRQLQGETGEARFGQVLALLRQPGELAQSYVAMVEENEIRSDLSHYERARIVRRALEEGVFASEKAALQGLFAAASYARRSKIKSFLAVVDALDGALRFPARMTERTGLTLSKALELPGMAAALRAALDEARAETPEDETACLLKAAAQGALGPVEKPAKPKPEAQPGVALKHRAGRIELTGQGVTPEFLEKLQAWIAEQG